MNAAVSVATRRCVCSIFALTRAVNRGIRISLDLLIMDLNIMAATPFAFLPVLSCDHYM